MSRYYNDRGPPEEPIHGRGPPRDYSPDYDHLRPSSRSGPVPPASGSPYPRGRIHDDGLDDHPRPQSPPYDGRGTLQVPSSHHRPRSLPPEHALVPHDPYHQPRHYLESRSPPRQRHHSRSRSRSSRHRSGDNKDPVSNALDRTFSHSKSGLGVGILGAVVGGLAAREMNNAAVARANGGNRRPSDSASGSGSPGSRADADKTRLMSTMVGALVGGLGANAIERRFEDGRKKTRAEQAAWERKWGPAEDADRDRRRGRAPFRDDDYRDSRDRFDEDLVYDAPPPRRHGRAGSDDGRYRW